MATNGYQKWLGVFKPEDSLRSVCNVEKRNRLSNVLADLQGIGCRVEKPTNGEGFGWRIIVDGSSDIAPDTWGDRPGFVGVDKKFALYNDDTPGVFANKVVGETSDTMDANDIPVVWDVGAVGSMQAARFHLKVGTVATVGPPVYILGQTTGGDLVWVPVADTCDPLEGGMKFARLVEGHIFMVDGYVPVTEDPCCCEPSPSPSFCLSPCPSPSLSPSLSLEISPCPSASASPSVSPSQSPSQSPSPSASASPSSEFPGAGWYCRQSYYANYNKTEYPGPYSCENPPWTSPEVITCEYIGDQSTWDGWDFGQCYDLSDENTWQFGLNTTDGIPHATASECCAECSGAIGPPCD